MFTVAFLRNLVSSSACRGSSSKILDTLKFRRVIYFKSKPFIHTVSSSFDKNRGGFDRPEKPPDEDSDPNQLSIHGGGKFSVFKDSDAEIILDVDEERNLIEQGFNLNKQRVEYIKDEFEGINLERGQQGVYDIEDLVDVLRLNNAKSIFVASLPNEINYADYIVVVSGQSKRHMKSLAEFIRKVFKKKCNSKGLIPHIEGGDSDDWLALDLGNIVLHIMSNKARERYDLESLWSVGSDYDSKFNDPDDPLITLLEEHTFNLADFQPMDTESPVPTKNNNLSTT